MTYTETLQSIDWPTEVLLIDFETYYDVDYILSKMSTVEYVTDPRFEFTGLGFEVLNHPRAAGPVFIPGPQGVEWAIKRLQKLFGRSLHNCTVVAKNCKFDLLILAEKFGIYPAYIIDVEDLSRFYDSRMSHKLKDLATYFKLSKPKGDTKQFKGLHYGEMSEEIKANLAEYGRTDIELETALLKILLPLVSNPDFELTLAMHTLNMYLRPVFNLDYALAGDLIKSMQQELDKTLELVKHTKEEISGTLSFTEIISDVLSQMFPPEKMPVKVGKPGKNMVALLGTKGVIPALAKTDEGFKQLLNHKDESIRNLMKAKVAIKSWPNWMKRVNSMVAQCKASGDKLRVPLKYYGGHTGRWSGTEKINVQNLGGRGRGAATHPLIVAVRNLLIAPSGHKLTIVDSAQIEARLLAWLAGQDDLTKGFADGEDIYSVFATTLFGEKVWKPTDKEKKTAEGSLANIRRGFGKDAILGCVAYGTPILTDNGWKPIEDVMLNDLLWDGHMWVSHKGVVDRGKKGCIKVNNVWMTPEHEILLKEGWTTAAELSMSNPKKEWFLDNLKFFKSARMPLGGSSPSNVCAHVVERLLRAGIIWLPENLHAVMSVLKKHPVKLRAIVHTYVSRIGPDCLTEFVQSLADATQNHIEDMVNEVSECGPCGSQIELLFLNTWQRCRGGIIKVLTSTGLITTEITNRETLDLLQEKKIVRTADILYVGKRHRFQAGDMIVSNCGYGMGANTFYERCRENDSLRPLFDSGEYDWDFINGLIKTYRKTYTQIPALWKSIEKAFRFVCKYPGQIQEYYIPGPNMLYQGNEIETNASLDPALKFWKSGQTVNIQLPSGRVLYYHHAKVNRKGDISYDHGKLWGGTLVENVIQAIARDLLGYWILECEKSFSVILHCHDEVVSCSLADEAESDLQLMIKKMSRGPAWAEGLPLAAEGQISECYVK